MCKSYHTLILITTIIVVIFPITGQTQQKYGNAKEAITWKSALDMTIEGRGWGQNQLKHPFDRLPAKAEKIVRAQVWSLSQDASGISVKFCTNSSFIQIKYKMRFEYSMPHMTDVGSKGFDLYCFDSVYYAWRWAGVVRPRANTYHFSVISGLSQAWRQYTLYLPLYSSVDSIYIGIEKSTEITAVENPGKIRPVVFYGTSILQGCSASRPGMAGTSIIGRMVNTETINLGFSGNARMEPELATLLGEINASCYVLDCLPNMTPEDVALRTVPFITKLRSIKPEIPIVIVEGPRDGQAWLKPDNMAGNLKENANLKSAYDELIKNGIKKIYYVSNRDYVFEDEEATVDGAHFTDIGFIRYAECMNKILEKIVH